MSTKVYKYSLRAPSTEHHALVIEQIRLAHRYRNTLVEIERGRRAAIRPLIHGAEGIPALVDAVRVMEAQLEEALHAQACHRAGTRKNDEPLEMKEAVKSARANRKEAKAALANARKDLAAKERSPEHEQINTVANGLHKNARAHRGNLYWGTYLLAEAAHEQACKTTPLFDGAEPNDPRFRRLNHGAPEGAVGVQIQKGLDTGDLTADGTLIKVEVLPDKKARKEGDTRRYGLLYMRINSDENGHPLWVTFPLFLHRPLPEGTIKTAVVHRKRVGPRMEWAVTFTVSTDDNAPRTGTSPEGTIALDLGWRQMEDKSLRVAVAWDGAKHIELRIPSTTIHNFHKADKLRSTRDQNFNASIAALRMFLGTPSLPQWLIDATKHIHAWRNPGKLARVALIWKTHRFDGDEAAYLQLETWRYHDHHLWEWESSERTKAQNKRQNLYRTFASELAKNYTTLILEDFDLRSVARKSNPEDGEENETSRANRPIVALHILRSALHNGFPHRVQNVNAANTTRECHVCHVPNIWEQALALVHTCTACGATWDQDENASINLYDRGEHSNGDKIPGTARCENPTDSEPKPKGRWQRAKLAKAEREAACNPSSESTESKAS